MIARTHDMAAITALIAVVVVMSPLPSLSLATILLSLLANQLGAIAPDIDQPTAPFWRNVSFGKLFGPSVTRLLGGHRFLTHSVLGVFLAGWLFHLLLQFISPLIPNVQTEYVWWAFMIGMLSHLIMDSFTKEGVPWLLPVPIKFGIPPVRRLRITTGKKLETYIIFPVLVLLVVALCSAYYPVLYELFQNRLIR